MHPGRRDEAWFKREMAPKLDAFTLSEIAAADGLIARRVLAYPCRCEGATSEPLGRLARASKIMKRLLRWEA